MKKIVNKESPKEPLYETIKKACQNLFYISETDAEVEFFFGGKIEILTEQTILAALGKNVTTEIEETEAQYFFERLTKTKEWNSETQLNNARGFTNLFKLLSDDLGELRVFKIGRVKIDIYIVGIDENGMLIGVKTKAVET